MGDREILETYLNSASKNTSETDIFRHGPKSLLTIVIYTRGVVGANFGNITDYINNFGAFTLFLLVRCRIMPSKYFYT